MENILNFREALKKELFRVLDYWKEESTDEEHGGFVGEKDFFNRLNREADKGIVLNARILYTFSLAYNFTKGIEYLHLAERAYEYLTQYFWDQSHEGFIWKVSCLGEPVDMRKQIYAQGFAIYGLAEYYIASGNQDSLDLAIRTFRLLEERAFDRDHGGYIEALGRDWTGIDDMRLSPTEANEPKSMNTHLHILEPYTKLHSIWKDELLSERLKQLVNIFQDRILDRATNHFVLFFDMDWKRRSSLVSYGHDIEATWLICEAAEELGDSELLKEVRATMLEVLDSNHKSGVDDDGAVFFMKDAASGKLDTDKHWWPQAESMVGFYNGYELTGDKNYLEQVFLSWSFIQSYIIDQVNGEWHWRVNRSGVPYRDEVKVGFWKCPYHNVRAMIEMLNRTHI